MKGFGESVAAHLVVIIAILAYAFLLGMVSSAAWRLFSYGWDLWA